MENFEYLNDFIDELLNKSIFIRKKKLKFDTKIIERGINLSTIEKYNFSDEELEYVMNCLKEKDVYVLGSSPALYTCFENYIYVVKRGVPRKSKDITKDEQIDLLRKYQETHDISYRNQVVESYIRLVNYIASKYADITGIDQDELASYGYEGLIVSIENYDLSKQRSSYFFNMINGYILNGLANEQGFRSNDKFYSDYVKARKKILQNPEYEDLSEYDLLEEILTETLNNRKDSTCSQEKSKNKFYEAYAISLEDIEIEDLKNNTNIVIEKEFQKEQKEQVNKTLEILSPMQKEIIKLRYGFYTDETLTLEEVANRVNLSINGVHLSIKRSLKKLNNNKKKKEELYELLKMNNDKYDNKINIGGSVVYEKKRRA